MAVTPGYVGSAGITWSASATASVAGQSIGTASWDRIVVVAVTIEDNVTFSSCTIAGLTATLGIAATNTTGTPDNAVAIFYAPVPTGTTGTISVTLNASSSLAGRISVWATTGASVPRTGNNSAQGAGTTQTLAGITISTGGAAYYVFNNATAATATVWTNATLRDDTATATYRHSVADTTTAGTPTVTADGATANQILAGISFEPAPPEGYDQIPQYARGAPIRPRAAALALAASGLILVPRPIPPPPDAVQYTGFTVTTAQVFNRTLNYQDTAYCPQPPPVAVAAITPDQWMLRWDRPPRELIGLASGEPFVPKEATRDNTTGTVWPLTQGEKARPLPRPAQQGQHLFVPRAATIDNTTGVLWPLQVLSEKARPIGRPALQGYHLFVPDQATIQNTTNTVWPLVFGERARPVPEPAPAGLWTFGAVPVGVDNTVTPDNWLEAWRGSPRVLLGLPGGQPFVPKEAVVDNTTNTVWPLVFGEIARPIERPAQQGDHLFVPKEAVLDNTTNTVWPLTQGEKARPIPRSAPVGYWAFGYPYLGIDNTTGIEKWQQPLSRSVPIPRTAPLGGQPFVPREATVDNTTGTVWPLTLGKVARPIMRVAQQGAWVFGYPYISQDNTTTIDKWQQSLGRAVPIPRPAQTGGAPFVAKEATVENTVPGGWWQPLQGTAVRHWWPTRPASPFVPSAATVDNTVPGGWWQPFVPGAPRRPFSFTQPVYASIEVAPPNTVTIDKWQQPLSVVVNLGWPRKNYLRGGQPFVPREATVDNTIRGIAWLEAWKGPPRYRPIKTQVTYPVQPLVVLPNTITGMAWLEAFKGPPRYRPPRVDGRFYVPHLGVVFLQSITCDVTVTVDMHICGWGTEAQEAEGFVEQAEQADPWSEQEEHSDDYDEKDECGR